jgi:hypothetical protein
LAAIGRTEVPHATKPDPPVRINGGGFTISFLLPYAGAPAVTPDHVLAVSVLAQTAGAALDQIALNIDGAAFGVSHDNPATWNVSLGGAYPEGTHQLQAFGLDKAGHAANAERSFDIGPPAPDAGTDGGLTGHVSIGIDSPGPGSVVGRLQKIVVTASDTDGDALTYTFLVNGTALTGCQSSTTASCLWDTASFAGDVTLEVHACEPSAIDCGQASETVHVPSWTFTGVSVPPDAPLLDVGDAGQLRILGRTPPPGGIGLSPFEEYDSHQLDDGGLSFKLAAQSAGLSFSDSCSGCYAGQTDGIGWIAWDQYGGIFSIAPADDGGFATMLLPGLDGGGPISTAQLFTGSAGTPTIYEGNAQGLTLVTPGFPQQPLPGSTGPVGGSIQLLSEAENGSSGPPAALFQQQFCSHGPCANRVMLAYQGASLAGSLPAGVLPNAAAHWAVEDSRGTHVAVAMPDGGVEIFEAPDAGGDYTATPLYGALVDLPLPACAAPGCPVYLSLVEDRSGTLHLIFPGTLATHVPGTGDISLVHGYFAPGAAGWKFELVADTRERSVQAALYQDAPVALVWNEGTDAILFTFR